MEGFAPGGKVVLAYSDNIVPTWISKATPKTTVATATIMVGRTPANPSTASTMVAMPPIASANPP